MKLKSYKKSKKETTNSKTNLVCIKLLVKLGFGRIVNFFDRKGFRSTKLFVGVHDRFRSILVIDLETNF